MAEEEAIEQLKKLHEWTDIFDYIESHSVSVSNAFELAIIALEKQIPKRLKTIHENNKMIYGYCPSCDGTIEIRKTALRSIKGKHCDWCGQKLDWSVK